MAGSLRGFFDLIRPSNSPSVISNVMVSGFIAGAGVSWQAVTICFAALFLYYFGMVLNDLFDQEFDRTHRPDRPLIVGSIQRSHARWIAALLFVLAWICAAIVLLNGRIGSLRISLAWLSLVGLSALIFTYSVGHKKMQRPEFWMGLCRVLLGLFVYLALATSGPGKFLIPQWAALSAYLVVIFFYTGFISWAARRKLFIEVGSLNGVSVLIAGFSIVDMGVFLLMGENWPAVWCMGLFFATLSLQPLARGT